MMMQKADDRWANKELGKEACRRCDKLYDSEELTPDGFCSTGCEMAHERAMFLSLLCGKCKGKVGEDEWFFDKTLNERGFCKKCLAAIYRKLRELGPWAYDEDHRKKETAR
jgi:hypothetical protein